MLTRVGGDLLIGIRDRLEIGRRHTVDNVSGDRIGILALRQAGLSGGRHFDCDGGLDGLGFGACTTVVYDNRIGAVGVLSRSCREHHLPGFILPASRNIRASVIVRGEVGFVADLYRFDNSFHIALIFYDELHGSKPVGRLRYADAVHGQHRRRRRTGFCHGQSNVGHSGRSRIVILHVDLCGIGSGGEVRLGLHGPTLVRSAHGDLRAAVVVDGKAVRIRAGEIDSRDGRGGAAVIGDGDRLYDRCAALYDAAEVNVTHLQGGCCSGALGYREAHIRLRGLAAVVGDHEGGGVGALREIAGGLYAVGSGFACLDGRYRTAQNESVGILANQRGAVDGYIGVAGVAHGEVLGGRHAVAFLQRVEGNVADDQLGYGRGRRFLHHEGHRGGDGLSTVIGHGDGRTVRAGGQVCRGLDGPGGVRRAGGNLRAAGGVDDKPGRVAGGDTGDGGGGAAGIGNRERLCGRLLITGHHFVKGGYDQPKHGSLDHDGGRLAGGGSARVGAGARYGDAQFVSLILGGYGVAGGRCAGNGRAVTIPLIGHSGLRRAGHSGQLVAHRGSRANGGIAIVADHHVDNRSGGSYGRGQTAALRAAVHARTGHDQLDLLADIIGGDGVGGRVAHLIAAHLPGIDHVSPRRVDGSGHHVAHDGCDGIERYARQHGVADNGVGGRAGDRTLVGAGARYAQLNGLAYVVGIHGIGGVGALDHATHQPFIADGSGAGRYGLHGQHAAHHRHIVVERDAGNFVVLVVDEELVHHPAHTAAHADAVPDGTLLQHGHLGAHAVDADLGITLAGAGAQAHAIAVAAPDGGIAQHVRVIGIVAAKVQELTHHIANGSADADAGPVGAALQHRYRRAHRISADDAVARAGAGAQAHTVAVVAGDISGSLAGNGTAHAQVIAVHIAGTAIRRLNLVPASAGAQDLNLGAGVIAGDGARAKIGRGAQPQPAADNGGVGRCHGGCGQNAQQHYRNQ